MWVTVSSSAISNVFHTPRDATLILVLVFVFSWVGGEMECLLAKNLCYISALSVVGEC